jgi:hypothetical protein
MSYNFTHKDCNFFQELGISEAEVRQQLGLFHKGAANADLDRAATINDGINQYSETEIDHFIDCFEEKKVKF